ncbi:unnamed protein product [Orchesella dallaii]|uniref:F-box domain-containing protein n=1 Tax=Orchesella dallaii TaxID=48710 RepID=A0ABP1RLI2_9HEXA
MSLSKENPSSSEKFSSNATKKTIADLPPEILTVCLKNLVKGNRKDLLSCRLVNPQWKKIIDYLLEENFVSGRLSPFPEIGLVVCPTSEEQSCQKLPYVRSHLAMFQNEANPLPFNGLHITGGKKHPFGGPLPRNRNPEEIHVSLPMFVATAGCGNLTSLAIKNQYIDFNILVTVLGSTPSLKILRLSNVVLSKDVDNLPPVLPPPPQLKSLTILALECSIRYFSEQIEAKNKLLFVWLVISFAEQLVKLILDTECPFPALRQGYPYSISVGSKTFSAGTTSASAFGKLKDLQVTRPGIEFLELSTTPALQTFYIGSFMGTRYQLAGFEDLASFIDKCRATLEKLWLNTEWSELLAYEGLINSRGSPVLLPTANITLPKLKMVGMRFPELFYSKVWKENFLAKCPALKELQVLNFQVDRDYSLSHANAERYLFDDRDYLFLNEPVLRRVKRNADRKSLYQNIKARHPGKRIEEAVAEYWVDEYEVWNICAELKNVYFRLRGSEDCYVVRKPTPPGPLP